MKFENYFESFPRPAEGEEAVNKERVFTNCVDFKAYDVIEKCRTYARAIEILDNFYVEASNAIFAQHLLATAKKQSDSR